MVKRESQWSYQSVFRVQTRQNTWPTYDVPITPKVPGKNTKTHKCPREAFWKDLVEEVIEAQAEGDQVMILMDVNKDIKGPATTKTIKNGTGGSNHIAPQIKTATHTSERTRTNRWNIPVTLATQRCSRMVSGIC